MQLVLDEGLPPTRDVGVILMHGAGGDHSSGHLPDTARAFAESGFTTVRFSIKTSLAKRADACRAVLEHARRRFCSRWILAGHSMVGPSAAAATWGVLDKLLRKMLKPFVRQGARVASEVAHSDPAVLACVFFSYPVHPPGKQVLPHVGLLLAASTKQRSQGLE